MFSRALDRTMLHEDNQKEDSCVMNYGNIKYNAIEDGIGCRTVLFVSGCRHHCKGCFQPETWDFNFGEKYTDETENEIINSLRPKWIHGLTLLGGEPFEPENQETILSLVKKIRSELPEKSIWAYSGYTFEELTNPSSICYTKYTNELLKNTDILVDGEFKLDLKSLIIPYRGSTNQRVIDVPASLSAGHVILSPYNDKHSPRQIT